MSFSNKQKSELRKLLIKITGKASKNIPINYPRIIKEIEGITEDRSVIPACPMLHRQGVRLSACHKVLIGDEECGNCYSDVEIKR